MSAHALHQLSDHVLVAGAQAGDPQAIDTLISLVRPAVYNYCRHRLANYPGGIEASDDAAQETCVAILKVLPNYQQQGAPFRSFVYAIAANKVADAQRRFSRSAVLVDEFPEQTEPSPTPEERMIADADVQAAYQLLRQLPDRMREVLMLRAGGASAEMIGERLGLTANAVRVTQHRAVAKLRDLIESSAEYSEQFNARAEPRRVREAA